MGMKTVKQTQKTVDIIIPIYKPDASFGEVLRKLQAQSVRPQNVWLLQTMTTSQEALYSAEGSNVHVLPVKKQEFDHGATRKMGADQSNAEFVLFMTQDAMPADDALIERLLEAFDDDKTGVAYARQLARPQADLLERMTREYNYPAQDQVKTAADLERLGIKTFFCSDVCAMYRHSLFDQLGGFVHPTIFNEDMIMASAVIHAGYQVVYRAEAKVIHSHAYTCMQQFHRNFDLGVSQRQYREVFEAVSSEKEGAGYAGRTLKYLLGHGKPCKAFYFAMQCGFKLIGYKLGLHYEKLSDKMILWCTSNKEYWNRKEEKHV